MENRFHCCGNGGDSRILPARGHGYGAGILRERKAGGDRRQILRGRESWEMAKFSFRTFSHYGYEHDVFDQYREAIGRNNRWSLKILSFEALAVGVLAALYCLITKEPPGTLASFPSGRVWRQKDTGGRSPLPSI